MHKRETARPLLRAAVIGLGVGERHAAAYYSDSRCELVALCDFDEVKLAEVGSRYHATKLTTVSDEILCDPNVDVVSIASYDNHHASKVISALKAGKNVFVEKPLCLYSEELTNVTAALEKAPHLKLSSNFVLRKVERFKELKNKITAGKLGQIYYLEGDYDYGRIEKITDGWRGLTPGYSVFHGGGIHLVDLILWLSGRQVCEVFAYGTQIGTSGSVFKENDMVCALLKLDGGIIAKVTANFPSVTPHFHKLCVYGTQGSFIQSHGGASYQWSREKNSNGDVCRDAYPDTSSKKKEVITSFVSSIIDGGSCDVLPTEVLEVRRVSLAIEKSIVLGKPVRL